MAVGGWRAFLLRRLLGRLRISDDIVRHLSSFQLLGERLEVEAPLEMLPVGARTLFRGIRTRAAVQIRPDWLWPYWIERQLDPTSPSFVPRGHLPLLTNLTHRNWTMVGNPRSPWEAIVDPTGLVTPWFDAWSVDWLVRDAGRWKAPSRHPALRQRLAAPVVVETTVPADAGDFVHRVYAEDGAEEVVVIEIENRTPTATHVAFTVRPYNPEGLAVVESLSVQGSTVTVDGVPALVFDGPVERWWLSTFRGGDTAYALLDGREHGTGVRRVHDEAGLAHGAFEVALGAGERARVTTPIRPGRAGVGRRARPPARTSTSERTSKDDGRVRRVAERWRDELDRGMRVELPDERMQQAVDANRAYLLLFHDGEEITPGPFTYHRFWFRDAAFQLAALDRWGFHDEVERVVGSYPARQRRNGFFYSQHREWDSNGAAIWAIAEHTRLTRRAPPDGLLEAVDRGARWITSKRREGAQDRDVAGLLPPGISAEHLGPHDFYFWDDFWSLAGVRDAADLLAATRPGRAAALGGEARRFEADVIAALERAAARQREPAIPAGPRRGLDPGMIGSLAAVAPLRVLPADHPLVVASVDVIDRDFCLGDGFFQGISHTGLATYLTLQLALVELELGRPRCWQRFRWLMDAATPTFTWPEAIHPRLGGGCMGDGHHGWAAADVLSFLRQVLVRETDDGLALFSVLPEEWRGRAIRVSDAPTHHGTISFDLDWEGSRPVLRWERAGPPITLTAPGIAAGWRTDASEGSTVLAPHDVALSSPSAPAGRDGADGASSS